LYQKHERTFEDLEGQIEQWYDGTTLNDTTQLKRVTFNRPTNFYWLVV
jgi:hypothetical protein